MKLAMKKAARKAAPKKAAPLQTVLKKAPVPPPVQASPGSVQLSAAREALTTSVRDAAIAALANISPGLVQVTPTGVKPFGLLDRTFNDPLVGLDGTQMPFFFAAVSTAINDARVDALIEKNLAASPTSAATIIDVVNLIQFWVDHPDVTA